MSNIVQETQDAMAFEEALRKQEQKLAEKDGKPARPAKIGKNHNPEDSHP